jgi:Tfp pilus assembly protein FimT
MKRRRTQFTLFEMILVMVLLATALSLTAPSLGGFIKSRAVQEESRRVLALTRYAASAAASRGASMSLTYEPDDKTLTLTCADDSLNNDILETFVLTEGVEILALKNEVSAAGELTLSFSPTGLIDRGDADGWLFRNQYDADHAITLKFDEDRQQFVIADKDDE